MEKKILTDLFCHQCQLQFNGKSVYNLHLSLVHKYESDLKNKDNLRNSSFDFDKCEEIIVTNHKIKKCEGKKPFTCEVCSTTFILKSSLKRHSARIHGGKNSFICDICGVGFGLKRT